MEYYTAIKNNRILWYTHTMEYCTAIKNNKILSFAANWMELEAIILSELTQI